MPGEADAEASVSASASGRGESRAERDLPAASTDNAQAGAPGAEAAVVYEYDHELIERKCVTGLALPLTLLGLCRCCGVQ